jgi:DNA-binding beta-propeller fold protein YncE
MQHTIRILAFTSAILALRVLAEEAPMTLKKSIGLPGVEGRIDHMAIDPAGERLFVAALGNDSVEVIDLKQGTRLKSLTGLKEAQGLGWAPEAGKLFVACGGDGSLHVFDGATLQQEKVIHLGDDADNVRYCPTTKQLYVGYGSGAIAIVDPVKESVHGEIKVSSHPESFEVDRAGKHIFVNVPSKHVEVLDTEQLKLTADWKLSDASSNFPMSFDENSKRLFIGCRSPAKILVLDSESGRTVAALDGPGDIDDVFFAPKTKRIYSSGGDGVVFIHKQSSADHYELAAKFPTAPGARTSLLSPDESHLYVAVPHRGSQQAEIRTYQISSTWNR